MRRIEIILVISCLAIINIAKGAVPSTIDRAIELYNDGRWIDSRVELLQLKSDITTLNHSDNEVIDYYLALCAVELRSIDMEHYLTRFEERYPSSRYLNKIRFARAVLYSSEERLSEAKRIFEMVEYSSLNTLEREKYDMRVGYINFLDQDYNGAKPHFERIDERSDIYHHALYYLSYIDYIEGNNGSARSGFTALLESEAYSAVAPYYLLQIEFNDGHYREVITSGESLYEHSTADRQMELARSMAEAAFRLEDYSATISYLDKYQSNGGAVGRAESYLLGFSLYREVRYKDAVQHLRAACGADDALTQNASYHLADCYLRLGDRSSAINSFAMAANDAYNAVIAEDALFNYAKLQYEMGVDRFSETINILTRYLNKYPDSKRSDDAKRLLIAAYYNSRDFDAAYKSIKELKNPDSDIRLALQRIALYRGLESYNTGDYESAVANISESLAINISPKYSSTARFWLGEIDYTGGDYLSALKNYNSYLVSAPTSDENYSLSLYNLAYTKMMLDSTDEALGFYQRYVASESEDSFYRADAYNRVGDILYGKRQFKSAKDSYSKAIASSYSPRYYALYQHAIINGIDGNYPLKIKELKQIISSGEGEYVEDALYELGRSYIAAGDYNNGVEAQERFIKIYPSSSRYAQSLSDLGLAYLNLGDRSKSIEYYDRAIKAAPQSAVAKDALQGIREIYINQGDADGYFAYASSVGHSGDLGGMTRDSLSFVSAQRLYLNGEGRSPEAIISLNNYVADYPKGYYTTDALFYLSDSYLKQSRNKEAITTLTKLTQMGSNQYSERVYDRLSALTFSEGQYLQSATAYRELYSITKSRETKSRALMGYADATIAEGSGSSILKMVEFIEGESNIGSDLKLKISYHKAQVLFERGDKSSSLPIFKNLSSDPSSAFGAEASYILISEAFKAGDIEQSEQMIFDFAASDTPQSYWLAEAFIVLGDIYSFREDYFQARATYQSIIDGYTISGDGVVEKAKSKIDKLP